MPEPSAFEVYVAPEKLKRNKSTGIGQIPAEMIKARSRTICSEIHKLVYFLLGIFPASNYSWPTFRNPVSVPSSKAGCTV